MKTIAVVSLLAAAVSAQATFDNATNTFTCAGAAAGKNFCAGDSLSSNIIIRCDGATGHPGNCNDNLAGQPPVGVKTNALCYQSTATAGDAACSLDGKVFPENGGAPFTIQSSGAPASGGNTTAMMPEATIPEATMPETTTPVEQNTTAVPVSVPPEASSGGMRLAGVGLFSGAMALVAFCI